MRHACGRGSCSRPARPSRCRSPGSARLRGIPVVYVESLARAERPSLSCRLVAPVADRVYVQWPELLSALPRARYAGTVFGER